MRQMMQDEAMALVIPNIERALSDAVNFALFSTKQPPSSTPDLIARIADRLLLSQAEIMSSTSLLKPDLLKREVSTAEVEAVQGALQDAVQHAVRSAPSAPSEEAMLASIVRKLREQNAEDRWRLIRKHVKALSEPHHQQQRVAAGDTATPRDAVRNQLATPRGPADRWRDALSQIVQRQQQQQPEHGREQPRQHVPRPDTLLPPSFGRSVSFGNGTAAAATVAAVAAASGGTSLVDDAEPLTAGYRLEGPLPVDPDALHLTLPSGLRVLVMPNGRPSHEISMRLVVSVGSLDEAEGERGIAHLVEHRASSRLNLSTSGPFHPAALSLLAAHASRSL